LHADILCREILPFPTLTAGFDSEFGIKAGLPINNIQTEPTDPCHQALQADTAQSV
jgi:hypothetical protein